MVIRRLRYRLASRLLGYAPVPVPDTEGVYIVYRSGPGKVRADAIFTADKFRLRMQTRLRPLGYGDRSTADFILGTEPPATTGRFVGTVKVR